MNKITTILIIVFLFLNSELFSQEDKKTNSIGMKLKLIKSGEFKMGYDGINSTTYESPVHQVTITRDYYISTCEVTQQQYEKIMNENPSSAKGSNLPINYVSYNDAVMFCKKLSKLENKKYRIPTEAEWEYACRAGSKTKYYWGDDFELINKYEWFLGNSSKKIQKVATKEPNAWGIYDLLGNVSEWCSGRFAKYQTKPQTDPKGSAWPWKRVIPSRGGNYLFERENHFHSSFRHPVNKNHRDSRNGFRIVLEIK